jgi:hypothetical protein
MRYLQSRRTFLIEFNELSPTLLTQFIGRGLLPAFEAFRRDSLVFTTDAGEDPPALEPWIQWPTVHSGLPYSEHGVFALGDGRRILRTPLLGDVLSAAGVSVGICSAMNMSYGSLGGYVLPDPWDVDGQAYPASLGTYYRTVAAAVQESSRHGLPPPRELARFVLFLLRNGLRPGTVRSVVTQLVAERRTPSLRWRRASVLDELQYDVFRHLNRQHKVEFASFFSNSTAHYQHYYWRNMEPELFEAPPPDADSPSLAGAILHGYRSMDRLLAKFMADEPDALLVLCTALSQEPWSDTTKQTFRPRSYATLFAFAGIDLAAAGAVKPMMAEQFQIELPDKAQAARTEAALNGLTIDGHRVLTVQRTETTLQAGCMSNRPVAEGEQVRRAFDNATRPFHELFYPIHTTRSGRHHRDGVLWIRTGEHRTFPDRVPLTHVAPTILARFGVPQPAHMKGQALPLGMLERSA